MRPDGGKWPKLNLKVSARVAVQGESVRFIPVPNYHGNVTVKVRGCEVKGKGSSVADYEVADTFKNIFLQMVSADFSIWIPVNNLSAAGRYYTISVGNFGFGVSEN